MCPTETTTMIVDAKKKTLSDAASILKYLPLLDLQTTLNTLP